MTAGTPPPAGDRKPENDDSQPQPEHEVEYCPTGEACGHLVTAHDEHGCHEDLGGLVCGCTIAFKIRKWTDLGNAKRLHDHYGVTLRYIGDGEWAAYSKRDGVWTFSKEAADPPCGRAALAYPQVRSAALLRRAPHQQGRDA